MRIGAIRHWKKWTFPDGSSKSKFTVCIGLDEKKNTALLALATSQRKKKSPEIGCHKNDWPQNYKLPPGLKPFSKETWILLDAFHLVDLSDVDLTDIIRAYSRDICKIIHVDKFTPDAYKQAVHFLIELGLFGDRPLMRRIHPQTPRLSIWTRLASLTNVDLYTFGLREFAPYTLVDFSAAQVVNVGHGNMSQSNKTLVVENFIRPFAIGLRRCAGNIINKAIHHRQKLYVIGRVLALEPINCPLLAADMPTLPILTD